MKLRIRKCISGLLCVAMICMSFMHTAYAKPAENEPPNPEYDITYRSTGEDDTGFTAQFTIKNNTEQAMADWSFDFDYNEVIEQADTATVTVTDGNQQYKKHYQFKGMEGHKIIPAKSELVIQYRVNAELNINDNPQNYDFKYTLQPENPFLPSETEAYTRQEWIADLMETMGYTYNTSELNSSYIDVSIDSPYLNAIEMALNHQVITTEEIGSYIVNDTELSSPVFHPIAPTDREFAVLTSLKALGYMDIDTPLKRFNIAKNIELINVANNGKVFTTNEAKAILESIKNILNGSNLEEGFNVDIDYKQDVISLSQELINKGYEFQDDVIGRGDIQATLILPHTNITKNLKANDIVILPANDKYTTDVAQKIVSIEEMTDEQIIISTKAPDFSEVVGANGIQVKGSTLADFSSFQPADDIEYLGESVEQSISTKDITVKIIDGKLVTTFKTGNPYDGVEVNGSLTIEPPKLTVDADIDPGFLGWGAEINKVLIKLDASASSSTKVKSHLIPKESKKLLGKMKVPISTSGFEAIMEVYLVFEATGEITVTFTSSLSTGVEYTSENGYRNFNSANSEIDVIPLKASGFFGPSLNVSLDFLGFANIADIEGKIGAGFEASETVRENSSLCMDASMYLLLKLTAFTKDSIVGDFLGLTIEKNVFNKNNSPLKGNIHYEYTPVHNGKVPYCSFGKSEFKGKVVDFENNQGIPVEFQATKIGSADTSNIETKSSTGYLEMNDVASGTYNFIISSTGYKTYTGKMTLRNGVPVDLGIIKMVKDGTGSLNGKVTNAINGTAIENVSLTLFNGADIDSTNEVDATVIPFEGNKTTNSAGNYNISVSNGYYTLKMQKTGFETSYINVTVSKNPITENITLVPNAEIEGTDIGDLRIVLTWGAKPRDLDSHLLGPTANGIRRFHTYYSSKTYNENGRVHAFLDHDDTTSYGPETTTVYNMNTSGRYSFYVHDYTNRDSSNSKQLSSSDATVRVYKKEATEKIDGNGNIVYISKLIGTYKVPDKSEGTVWHVFDYNALTEQIIPRNTLTYTSNPGDVGNYLSNEILNDTEIADIDNIAKDLKDKKRRQKEFSIHNIHREIL